MRNTYKYASNFPFHIIFLLAMGALFTGIQVHAADYQYSIPIGDRDARAFLWVPPQCTHLRGLLLASQVILEKKVCDDPVIRQACASEDLGIVILYRPPSNLFPDLRVRKRDQVISDIQALADQNNVHVTIEDALGHSLPPLMPLAARIASSGLQEILNTLAEVSGYHEVSTAPLLTLGHSGGAIFAWNVAYAFPERALGVIGLHSAVIMPPIWAPMASPTGIPALCVSGEYESWGSPDTPLDQHWRWLRGGVLDMRGHWDAEACEIVQPGGTHFNWDSQLAQFTAQFIERVAHYRLPPAVPDSASRLLPAMKSLSISSGWLTDTSLLTPSRFAPAPYAKFQGDPWLAFWHMDSTLAQSAERFSSDYGGKKDQRVTFVQNGSPVPASWIEPLKFEPLADGITVKVTATFLDKTPEGVAGAGKKLGHANGPIRFRLIGGWGGGGEQIGLDTFRIRFDHFGTGHSCCNLMIMAYQEGDAIYKYAEQPCQITFPDKNTEGVSQRISFPKIASIKAGRVTSLPLLATSDSGLPVSYYVRSGPAVVQGSALNLTTVPPGTKYPVELTVVAYQWGRSIAPLVQSATPVAQTVFIEHP